MLRFFVSVMLPSLIVATVWLGALGYWVTRKVNSYRARHNAVLAQRNALRLAQDALAAVISDSLASGSVREQALPAYEALGRLLREKAID